MSIILNSLLGIIALCLWYLAGVVGIGLFAAAHESEVISPEAWRKRKRILLVLALLGPVLYVLFVLWSAICLLATLGYYDDKRYSFNLFLEYIVLGFKNVHEEERKREAYFRARS